MLRIIFVIYIVSYVCVTPITWWKQLKPLESNRESVEKLLGKGEVDEFGLYTFESEGYFLKAAFTSDRCKALDVFPNRGLYDVEPGTLLEYWVYFENPKSLEELGIALSDFREETDSHLPDLLYLINDASGVRITIDKMQDSLNRVKIEGFANKEKREKLTCAKFSD